MEPHGRKKRPAVKRKNGTENASEKTEAAEAADTEDTAEAAGPEDDDSGEKTAG